MSASARRGQSGRPGIRGASEVPGGRGASEVPRLRLFVALELPPDVREALVAWAAEALSSHPEVRRLTSDHLHVTLCFLGWQSENAIADIAGRCRTAVEEWGRGAGGAGGGGGSGRGGGAGGAGGVGGGILTLAEAVWLPPRRPRVLAVRLAEEDGRVVQLQSRLSDLLEEGGWYVPERRPYLPHVTVARVGARSVRAAGVGARARGPDARAGARPAMRPFALPSPPALTFPAARITLFRSRLSPAGAQYEGLTGVDLTS